MQRKFILLGIIIPLIMVMDACVPVTTRKPLPFSEAQIVETAPDFLQGHYLSTSDEAKAKRNKSKLGAMYYELCVEEGNSLRLYRYIGFTEEELAQKQNPLQFTVTGDSIIYQNQKRVAERDSLRHLQATVELSPEDTTELYWLEYYAKRNAYPLKKEGNLYMYREHLYMDFDFSKKSLTMYKSLDSTEYSVYPFKIMKDQEKYFVNVMLADSLWYTVILSKHEESLVFQHMNGEYMFIAENRDSLKQHFLIEGHTESQTLFIDPSEEQMNSLLEHPYITPVVSILQPIDLYKK